ncbi:glycosyltransferase family 4 protein [Sinomonas sp. P47F7]|uniref:glycosyltransferase family 4 protein n=1 Tax=Sinomonas sp. P47F7 TaxID=3410987 RepID=UPI003BF50777
MGRRIILAASDGSMGGAGAVLLTIAAGLRELGAEPLVVAPAEPGDVVRAARERGLEAEAIEGRAGAEYARSLRRWRGERREGVLWCHGLLAATATAGLPGRIVHVHRVPTGPLRTVARLARLRALATVVPSEFLGQHFRNARVLEPWVAELEVVRVPRGKGPVRVGFVGRPSEATGIHLLADALVSLNRQAPYRFWLRIAGSPRFVDARERAIVEGRLAALKGSVQRVGRMPADEFLGTIDLLVCPSTVPEGFGLAVAEAMSARVPVIVSDAGALPDVVGPDYPWVARAGDSRHLADVIAEATRTLPASDVVDRAYARWKERYAPDRGIARLRELLDSLGLLEADPTGDR